MMDEIETEVEPESKLEIIVWIGISILMLLLPAAFGFYRLRSPAPAIGNLADDLYGGNGSGSSGESISRILVDLDGDQIELSNGGSVNLEDKYQVEIFISPYPPRDYAVDMDLYLTTMDGETIQDAEITIEYDMIFMAHGPYFAELQPIGAGHYLSSYEFFMYGPWLLDVSINLIDEANPLELPITLYVMP